MRTLFEIVESTKDGNNPSHEECYYALLVMDFLLSMESSALRDVVYERTKVPAKKKAEESFRRKKNAWQTSPKEYLGWNNDPANPDYQQSRAISTKIVNKLFDKPEKG